MAMLRTGRHGVMSSGELEQLLVRNGNFLAVRRAGSGDGSAGLHNSITGEYLCGIGGGMLPEYSHMSKPEYNCACTKGGLCRTGLHGRHLIRGWRNILFEIACRGHVRINNEIVAVLGKDAAQEAVSRLLSKAPTVTPEPNVIYQSVSTE